MKWQNEIRIKCDYERKRNDMRGAMGSERAERREESNLPKNASSANGSKLICSACYAWTTVLSNEDRDSFDLKDHSIVYRGGKQATAATVCRQWLWLWRTFLTRARAKLATYRIGVMWKAPAEAEADCSEQQRSIQSASQDETCDCDRTGQKSSRRRRAVRYARQLVMIRAVQRTVFQ